jgi:hypothetical protein
MPENPTPSPDELGWKWPIRAIPADGLAEVLTGSLMMKPGQTAATAALAAARSNRAGS